MREKRRWEKDYESYSTSPKLNDIIAKLYEKINVEKPNKEDKENYNKFKQIKLNLPKIANILELRGNLIKQLEKIDEEISRRKSKSEEIEKCSQNIENLEEEMQKLENEFNELQTEMENEKKKPDSEDKSKRIDEIQKALQENKVNRQKNNEALVKTRTDQLTLQKTRSKVHYINITSEELETKKTELKQQISVCNFACFKLMQGYSWKQLEVAMDEEMKGTKLTAKGENVRKMGENRAAAESRTPEEGKTAEEGTPEETISTDLSIPSKFDKLKSFIMKQPIAKWLSESYKKVVNYFGLNKEEKEEPTPPLEEPTPPREEPTPPLEEPTKRDAFRQYLRDVAAKGMDRVDQENRAKTIEKHIQNLEITPGASKEAIEKFKAKQQEFLRIQAIQAERKKEAKKEADAVRLERSARVARERKERRARETRTDEVR